MSHWKAAGIHLGISLFIAALVGSVIYIVWYPPPYFTVAGGSKLMLLIMGVDIVIGPLLTLTVYKHGKRGLKFDLAVIGILQATAFLYGLNVIAKARPVFIVAVVDRFTPVYANELGDADLARAARPEFGARSWIGPRLVAAMPPTDPKEKTDIVFSSIAGKDVDKFPKYYVPYEQAAQQLLASAHPLAALRDNHPTDAAEIERFATRHGERVENLVYLPIRGRVTSFTMVLSTTTKLPIGVLSIDPW